MRLPKKLKHSSLAFIVISVLIFATFTLIQAFNGDHGKDGTFIKDKIVQYLKSKKVRVTDERLKTIADRVYEESMDYDVDYRLVLAVMKVESNFRSDAVSRDGARGLLQIKPCLARHISKDTGVLVKGSKTLLEPDKNIKIGVNHISGLLEKFENLNTALHAYNVGSYRIKDKASNKDYSPNTPFTKKVLHEYNQMLLVLPDPDEE
jgi:soluble lytic murein transglycosylase